MLDNYVRSCAGYSAITYLLGIGDRHHRNLLLDAHGRLLHIDFGFILGRDPKPMPPLIKLSREMVEAMGGAGPDSEHFQAFRQHLFTAFLHLRRHANLFLNLVALMRDSSVPDIAAEPDKAVRKLEEKFHLGFDDERLVLHLQTVIDDSMHALFPALTERLHEWVLYFQR